MAHAQRQYHQNKNGKSRPYLSECQRGSKCETEQRRGKKRWKSTEKAKKRHSCLRRKWPESFWLAPGGSTRKEKTSPQRFSFVNNCIVFKVQEFMYKNTVVLASAPKGKTKRTEERHKLWGRRMREQNQNTERREEDESTTETRETDSYSGAAVLKLHRGSR